MGKVNPEPVDSPTPGLGIGSSKIGVKNKEFLIASRWLPAKVMYKAYSGEYLRSRGVFERVHLFLNDPLSSRGAAWFTVSMMILIAFSCLFYVLESLPGHRVFSDNCQMCKPV